MLVMEEASRPLPNTNHSANYFEYFGAQLAMSTATSKGSAAMPNSEPDSARGGNVVDDSNGSSSGGGRGDSGGGNGDNEDNVNYQCGVVDCGVVGQLSQFCCGK